MSERKRDGAAAPFQGLSPTQQVFRERLRTLHSVGSGASQATLSLSDLQTLESTFGRLGVSDSSSCQQPVLDNHPTNQFPMDSRSRGMNDRVSCSDLERELISQSYQSLWSSPNDRFAHKSLGYDFYGGSSNVAMGSSYTSLNGNNLRDDVPFSPRNPFLDQTGLGYSNGYFSSIRTNHDPYTMNNSKATILSRAKDRVESHRLQDVIAKGSRETINQIFDSLITHVCELMTDHLGYQVFQKLLKKCTDEQITQVLDIVIQQPLQFARVCVDPHGTRAIQDLMGRLCSEEHISRFMATLCHVALPLTKNTNANHVILLCFNLFSPSHNRYLLEVIAHNCYQVAIDQHGCCMLQQCIRPKSPPELKGPLIKEIITNALRLCVNCYGNYVVQYMLELGDCQVAAALSKHLDGNYVQLSYDKYGSHAVQKCLKTKEFSSRRIIIELLSDIDSLLVNPFGNYVIQTAWFVSQDDVRNELLYHINRNVPFMRCNIYGRKVLEKLNIWT